MTAMTPCPEDHPLMIAWSAYKATEDFANTRKWALYEAHVEGSLWAAFMAGFNAASTPQEGPLTDVQRSVRDGTFGVRSADENDCPGHIASEADSKVCARCGVPYRQPAPR